MKVISAYITPTQTAYIKGRNISDNLRLINSAIKLADHEIDMEGVVIALDAQKAFDSVNHNFLVSVLQKCSLSNFVPLFKLLYKDLRNDIMINGKLGSRYNITNGVKQGDALSCSLFILAIEPIIRNINNNDNIQVLSSHEINYAWPKILGYADDLTILTHNNNQCIGEVFEEYEHFTKASGLKLNADKTEIFTIRNTNLLPDIVPVNINYLGQRHTLARLATIKINGIIFSNNKIQMQEANLEIMKGKMARHFIDWNKRSLTLLGKIQIIKTFGLSQYLYTLAVINLNVGHWKTIRKLIYKFIWNKNMTAAPAPDRIRREVMLTPVELGGFGLVDLESVMIASRIKRYSFLMENNTHPVANLQIALSNNGPLSVIPVIDIEDVTTTVLAALHKHYKEILPIVPDFCIETHTNLRNLILDSKIRHLCQKNKIRSVAINTLTRRGIDTIRQALSRADNSIELALTTFSPILQQHIRTIHDSLNDLMPIGQQNTVYLYDTTRLSMVRAEQLLSRNIRQILEPRKILSTTKLLNTTVDNAINIYKNTSKIKSIQSKTKILRLIHGDVYCGAKLKKAHLSDNDRCIRCFAEETTTHLLLDCPYTREVWQKLGMNPTSLCDILTELDKVKIEIISQFLSEIVFRKKIIPTDILIRTIVTSFSSGLCRNRKIIERANLMLNNHCITGNWNIT